MVKLLWCAFLPFVANANANSQDQCIGGSFSLTVDDSVDADAWVASMKAAVLSMAGEGISADDVDVNVVYGGEAAPGDCNARFEAITAEAVPDAEDNATASAPTPAQAGPTAPTPAAGGNGTNMAPAPAASNASAPAPSPAAGNVSAPAPSPVAGNASAPAPSPAPFVDALAPSPSAGPSSGPATSAPSPAPASSSRRLAVTPVQREFLRRRLAEATANVAYTVVASASAIETASTALAAVDDDALAAAVEEAVAADDALATAFTGIINGSMAIPTAAMSQPSSSPPERTGDSAAFSSRLSLLGVAVAAGSLLV